MKKTIRTYRVAKKRQEVKKEKKKELSQIDSYISYYELFKSISK